MIVIRIELHSAITGKITTLATGKIANTGTGTPTQGNYHAVLRDAAGREWKKGVIEGFPRKRLLAWDLLYRVLAKIVGDRTPQTIPVSEMVTETEQHQQGDQP